MSSTTMPEFNAKFWQEDFEDDAREDARLHATQSSATTQKRYKRETTSPIVMGELAYIVHFACALLCITASVLAVLALFSNSVSAPMRAEPQIVTTPVELTKAPFMPSPIPTMQQPTTKRRNTNKPTAQPTLMLTYQIDDEHVTMWAKQAELKLQVRKGNAIGQPGNAAPEYNQKFREYVCDVAPNPPVRYAFPPRRYAEKQPLEQFLQHVQQMRFALLEYYHLVQYKSEDFYSSYASTNELTMRRIGKFFRQKLASSTGEFKLTVAAMGTSVMSGQDNCRETTYGPLLQRQLEHMLAPWPQAKVEIRTMGQNGDGPNYQSQMLCAADSLGSGVDFVHLWYAMISPADTEVGRQAFVRRMLQRGAVHIHTLVTNKETPWCPKELLQQGVCTKVSNLLNEIDWAPKHFWGRVDNGLCHNYTREGYVGTLMQNWHFGPIGFEVHTDQALMLYLDGLELALQSLIESKPIQSKPLGEINIQSKPADCNKEKNWWTEYTCERGNQALEILCVGGLNPNWNSAFPLNSISSSEAFPKLGGGANEWSYSRYKGPSTMRPYVKELEESNYAGRAECTVFPDVGYVYTATMWDKGTLLQTATEWLGLQFASIEQSLRQAKRVHVYLCTGKRDQKQAPMSKLGNFTVQVGINGKVLGRRDFVSPNEDCLSITANPIPMLQPSDVLGIQFISTDDVVGAAKKKTVQIGFVVLVGEQTPKQLAVPMPDFIYFDQTAAPSAVQTTTATPTESPVVERDQAPSFVEEEERAPSQDRAPSFADEDNYEEERAPSQDRAPSASNDE